MANSEQHAFSLQQLQQSVTFCTELGEKNENAKRLSTYAQDIASKIDYAKWKQKLVLAYNYIPLKRVAEKIQVEKTNYLKKIKEEEEKCDKVFSGKEFAAQMELFKQFSSKLNQKLEALLVLIGEEKIKRKLLEAQLKDKQERLKQLMRENMRLEKSRTLLTVSASKKDRSHLARSYSTKDRLTFSESKQKLSVLDRKGNTQKLRIMSIQQKPKSTQLLYRECLDRLVMSIQSMNSSEDIQSGIFLDIMLRPKKKYSHGGRHSIKSSICDTLIRKFGSIQADGARAGQEKTDFDMDWDTFKQLNWKQIMGIILVRDKGCERMLYLLETY